MNFDVIIATSTEFDISGHVVGYTRTIINFSPVCGVIAVLVVIAIFTSILLKQKNDK
jgi:hypothetical protein